MIQEVRDYHVNCCELGIFTTSSMLDDVGEEEDVVRFIFIASSMLDVVREEEDVLKPLA